MTTRDMICVSCPIGCALHVELDDDGKVLSVSGNTCKRGEKYAIDECTNPVRMLTSRVSISFRKKCQDSCKIIGNNI